MWFVYLLYSSNKNKHYVGYTNDLNARLHKHNTGKGAKYTRMTSDWVIIYKKNFSTKSEALVYEYFLKSTKKHRRQIYEIAHSPST